MKFDAKEIRERALRHIQEASDIIHAIDTIEHYFPDKAPVLPDVEPPPKKEIEQVNRALLQAPPRPKGLPQALTQNDVLAFVEKQKKPVTVAEVCVALNITPMQLGRGYLERLVAKGVLRSSKDKTGNISNSHGYRVVYARTAKK